MQLIDAHASLVPNVGDEFAAQFTQHIPDSLLDAIRVQREDSLSQPEGDMMHVCSVPDFLVVKWMREGFNVYREPAADIVARLKAEQAGYAFMRTKKRI